MDEITLKALAKINLGLDVVRRREDGYHEVRMIMQTIHLYDLLEIQKIREPEIQIVSNLSFLPVNENNLVYKAARLLQEEFALTDGISVKLTKRIPVSGQIINSKKHYNGKKYQTDGFGQISGFSQNCHAKHHISI